jgi:hypothetical protein
MAKRGTRRIRVVLVTSGDQLTDDRLEDFVYERLCRQWPGADIRIDTRAVACPEVVVNGEAEPEDGLAAKLDGWIEDFQAEQAMARTMLDRSES